MRVLFFCLIASTANADTVVPNRTIRAQSLITAQDLLLKPGTMPGTFEDIAALVGQEARVSLYAGRPVRLGDIGPPALVERNQIIQLSYSQSGLRILTEARALERAGAGEMIRVMNLNSRTTVSGRVMPDGTISVSY